MARSTALKSRGATVRRVFAVTQVALSRIHMLRLLGGVRAFATHIWLWHITDRSGPKCTERPRVGTSMTPVWNTVWPAHSWAVVEVLPMRTHSRPVAWQSISLLPISHWRIMVAGHLLISSGWTAAVVRCQLQPLGIEPILRRSTLLFMRIMPHVPTCRPRTSMHCIHVPTHTTIMRITSHSEPVTHVTAHMSTFETELGCFQTVASRLANRVELGHSWI
mmetsp:Transcript_9579/g.22004  ORF Transcript_9579/g.22004 Transcript_9579/m.22004 type:complete len:220 (-) Transcript_9579:208-867(-)